MPTDQQLVHAFYLAAVFLREKVRNDGWKWSNSYLREHARCASGLIFTNTVSPKVLKLLRSAHPEFKDYLDGVGGGLFDLDY